jgi:tetratricopeptide (TPR) repeat protein
VGPKKKSGGCWRRLCRTRLSSSSYYSGIPFAPPQSITYTPTVRRVYIHLSSLSLSHTLQHFPIIMQHAIDLNNEGSILLRNGFFEDAVAIFNNALAMIQNDLTNNTPEHDEEEEEEEEEEEDNHENDDDDDDEADGDQQHEAAHEQEQEYEETQQQCHCREEISTDVAPTTMTPTEKHDSSFSQSSKTTTTRMMLQGSEPQLQQLQHDDQEEVFIFRNPIFISSQTSSSLSSSSSLMDYSTLSITIVFNLALAHQLTAISQDMEPRRLYTALKLYEVGYLMQRNAVSQPPAVYPSSSSSSSSSNATTPPRFLSLSHTLGLVNNCGQIYQQLGQPKRAQRFFTTLLSTLILLGNSSSSSSEESSSSSSSSHNQEDTTSANIDAADDEDNDDEKDYHGYCSRDQLEGFWKTASQLILKDPQLASAA